MFAAEVIQISDVPAWVVAPFILAFIGGLGYALRWILRAPPS